MPKNSRPTKSHEGDGWYLWGKIPGRSCRRLRYWSMLSVGTDGCRHLSSLRWDSGPYFEADKDCVWKWRWVCDLAIIGICFEARAFWKPKKSEQRWNEDVRKDTHNTCHWATSFTPSRRCIESVNHQDLAIGHWSAFLTLNHQGVSRSRNAEMGDVLLFAGLLRNGGTTNSFQDTGIDVGK